jgi:hypothetical protein
MIKLRTDNHIRHKPLKLLNDYFILIKSSTKNKNLSK